MCYESYKSVCTIASTQEKVSSYERREGIDAKVGKPEGIAAHMYGTLAKLQEAVDKGEVKKYFKNGHPFYQ